jgi:hypothetical protein
LQQNVNASGIAPFEHGVEGTLRVGNELEECGLESFHVVRRELDESFVDLKSTFVDRPFHSAVFSGPISALNSIESIVEHGPRLDGIDQKFPHIRFAHATAPSFMRHDHGPAIA